MGSKRFFFFVLITGLDKILSAYSFIITVLDIEELSTFGIFFLAKLFHSAIAMSINSVTIWGKSLFFFFFKFHVIFNRNHTNNNLWKIISQQKVPITFLFT